MTLPGIDGENVSKDIILPQEFSVELLSRPGGEPEPVLDWLPGLAAVPGGGVSSGLVVIGEVS